MKILIEWINWLSSSSHIFILYSILILIIFNDALIIFVAKIVIIKYFESIKVKIKVWYFHSCNLILLNNAENQEKKIELSVNIKFVYLTQFFI